MDAPTINPSTQKADQPIIALLLVVVPCFFRCSALFLFISTVLFLSWYNNHAFSCHPADGCSVIHRVVTSLVIPITNRRPTTTVPPRKRYSHDSLLPHKRIAFQRRQNLGYHDILHNNPQRRQQSLSVLRIQTVDVVESRINDDEEQFQRKQLSTLHTPSSSMQQLLVTIPIFPLRKSVKIPTDNITLNLYEPRYIKMVEEAIVVPTTGSQRQLPKHNSSSICNSIGSRHDSNHNLNNDHTDNVCSLTDVPLFGALYTTNLPHIVVSTYHDDTTTTNNLRAENTFIVPIVEPNMIGALFLVTNHTVSSARNNPNDRDKKVIRLNATSILRFRIIEIVSTGGYDDLLSSSNSTVCDSDIETTSAGSINNNKPYIVAKVQLLLSDETNKYIDDPILPPNNSSHFDRADDLNPPLPDEIIVLPNYLQEIVTNYGTTILSSVFITTGATDCNDRNVASKTTTTAVATDTLHVLEKLWKKELVQFYKKTSSSLSSRDSNAITSHSEVKERLGLLSENL